MGYRERDNWQCKEKSDFPFFTDGNKINDKLTTSNHFNIFFAKIGPCLSNEINRRC